MGKEFFAVVVFISKTDNRRLLAGCAHDRIQQQADDHAENATNHCQPQRHAGCASDRAERRRARADRFGDQRSDRARQCRHLPHQSLGVVHGRGPQPLSGLAQPGGVDRVALEIVDRGGTDLEAGPRRDGWL